MKHALLILQPPYATQIINQLDGSIMFKFELERKEAMVDMFAKAILELNEMRIPEKPAPEPIHLRGRIVPLKTVLPNVPVSTVEPDTGKLPPMQVVAAPSSVISTAATCDECGATGSPSTLIHLETCSSFKSSIDVDGGSSAS